MNKGKINKLQKQSTTNFKGASVGFGGSKEGFGLLTGNSNKTTL